MLFEHDLAFWYSYDTWCQLRKACLFKYHRPKFPVYSTPLRRPKKSESIATLPNIAPNPDRRYYIYFRMCKRSVRRACNPFLHSQHRAYVAMERSRLLSAPDFFSESWRSRLTLITVRAVVLERFQILDSKCDVSGSPGAGISRCGADIARATRLERCHFSSTLYCADNARVTTDTQCQRSVL